MTHPVPAPTPAALAFPTGPLGVTMAMQTLATMAAFSVPSLAPAIARDIGVDGALTGYFVSLVYGVGIVSSLLGAGLIHRFGAVRVTQLILLAAVAMLLISVSGGVVMLAAGAVALGTAYGATAPVSAHLLIPRTPPSILNLVLSIRQVSVPLGGVLAALVLPPVALHLGWKAALLILAVPIGVMLVCLEIPRRKWDEGSGDPGKLRTGSLRQVRRLLAGNAELRRLVATSFVYSGLQLSFIAFTTVQLTSRAGFGLVAAGQALALFQVTGVIARPFWGWVADRFIPARRLLVGHGFAMGLASCAAAWFGPQWPVAMVFLVCALAGLTVNGFTGIAYAEFARLGGAYRTEATGLGSAALFSGVLILPSVGAWLVTMSGSYLLAYSAFGAAAVIAGLLLASGPRKAN